MVSASRIFCQCKAQTNCSSYEMRSCLILKTSGYDQNLLRRRAAITQLHPDGPAAAAADEQRADAEARTRRAGFPGAAQSAGPSAAASQLDTLTTGDSEERLPDLGETDHEGYSSFSGECCRTGAPFSVHTGELF